MSKTEMPLYPKLSSIYNKILQLAIAIICIVALFNLMLAKEGRSQQVLKEHFTDVGKEFIHQAVITTQVLLAQNNHSELKQFIASLNKSPLIYDAHFYDETGRLIASSERSASIKELFGLAPNKANLSEQYVPFVQEIYMDELAGYLRITLKASALVDDLNVNREQQMQLERLMLLLAGFVGFLLTRGFNRFSRQGYRLPDRPPVKGLVKPLVRP